MFLLKINRSAHFSRFLSFSSNKATTTATSFSESKLKSGQILHQGSAIYSKNSNYLLVLQRDGNLVLLNNLTDSPVWSSNTAKKGQGPYRLILLRTGSLGIYDRYNGLIWTTVDKFPPSDNYSLSVENDGNLILYNQNNQPIWDLNGLSYPIPNGVITSGNSVFALQYLLSPNKQYKAILQHNGNLEIFNLILNVQIWSSNSAGKGNAPYTLKLENNGSISIYDKNLRQVWSSPSSNEKNKTFKLTLENSGSLYVSDQDGDRVWKSNNNLFVYGNPVTNSDGPNTLSSGRNFTAGMSLISLNNVYNATLLANGNFVITKTAAGKGDIRWNPTTSTFELFRPTVTSTVWSTHTANKGMGKLRLILQDNGILALYDMDNRRIWKSSSRPSAHANYTLTLTNDGNLIINDGQTAIWDIKGTVSFYRKKNINILTTGKSLRAGKSLVTPDNKYSLELLTNGNLVLNYFPDDASNRYHKRTLWESNTADIGSYPYRLVMEPKGRAIVVDGNLRILWSSRTRSSGATLQLANNGNLVINDSYNYSIFQLFSSRKSNFKNTITNLPYYTTIYRSALYADQDLRSESSLVSKNLYFELHLSNTGLSIRHYPQTINTPSNYTNIWTANITYSNNNPLRLHLENNGNLVLFNNYDVLVWTSGSSSRLSNNYFLYISNSGSLRIINSDNGMRVWKLSIKKQTPKAVVLPLSTQAPVVHQAPAVHQDPIKIQIPVEIYSSVYVPKMISELATKKQKPLIELPPTLKQGKSLKEGSALVTYNKKYALTVRDGAIKLIFFQNNISNSSNNMTLWSSSSQKKGYSPHKMKLLRNGNLILVDVLNTLIWQSNSSSKANTTYILQLSETGDLSIFNNVLTPIWDTEGHYKKFITPVKPVVVNDTKPINITVPKPKKIVKKPVIISNFSVVYKLNKGQVLKSNQLLVSSNNKFELSITNLGNLVLTNKITNQAVWSSNTSGKGLAPYTLVLKTNGNLVLLSKDNKKIWQSNTSGKNTNNYSVLINNQGGLVIYKNKYEAIWDNRGLIKKFKNKVTPSSIYEGTYIKSGKKLYSKNKKYTLDFGLDGNLVLFQYPIDYNNIYGKFKIWNSNTSNKGVAPYKLTLRPNGNLVLTDKNSKFIWSTGTRGKKYKNYKAKLLNKGMFAVLKGNEILWDSIKGIHKTKVLLKPTPKPKPLVKKPKNNKPKSNKPKANKPKSNKPKSHKPKANKPKPNKPKANKPKPHKPKTHKPKPKKPKANKPKPKVVPKPPAPIPPPNRRVGKDVLNQKDQLNQEEYLFSADNRYTVEVSDNANLNIYFYPETVHNLHNRTLVWSSNSVTKKKGPFKLILKKSGSLNIVTVKKNKKVWTSSAGLKKGDYFARIENNGNLVVYKKKNSKPVWDTLGETKRKIKKFIKSKKMKPIILANHELKQGSILYSDNLKWSLEILNNGNLAIFNYPKGIHKNQNKRNIVWSTTSVKDGKGPYKLKLQKDGVFVVVDKKNKIRWKSSSGQKKASKKLYLKLQDDGDLVIIDKNAKPVWDLYNQFYLASEVYKTNALLSGQSLKMGSSLFSKNKLYSLDVQFDGNLVIYKYPSGLSSTNNRKPIWFTNNNVKNSNNTPFKLKLTVDGNLILTDKSKKTIWSSNSQKTKKSKKNKKFKLVMKNNGKLVIYNNAGKQIWISN